MLIPKSSYKVRKIIEGLSQQFSPRMRAAHEKLHALPVAETVLKDTYSADELNQIETLGEWLPKVNELRLKMKYPHLDDFQESHVSEFGAFQFKSVTRLPFDFRMKVEGYMSITQMPDADKCPLTKALIEEPYKELMGVHNERLALCTEMEKVCGQVKSINELVNLYPFIYELLDNYDKSKIFAKPAKRKKEISQVPASAPQALSDAAKIALAKVNMLK